MSQSRSWDHQDVLFLHNTIPCTTQCKVSLILNKTSCLWSSLIGYEITLNINFIGVDILGVDILGVDILGVDILGVDISGVDILGRRRTYYVERVSRMWAGFRTAQNARIRSFLKTTTRFICYPRGCWSLLYSSFSTHCGLHGVVAAFTLSVSFLPFRS